jgi:hypothetical protein
MSKHTPGPWTAKRGSNETLGYPWEVMGPDGKTICDILLDHNDEAVTGEDLERAEANARLIAAAPALLEALREAERVIRWAAQESAGRVKAEIIGGWLYHADKCRAAIAQAEGT